MAVQTPLPASQSALKIQGPNALAVVSDAPLPNIEPNDVLVSVHAVSINHVDGKAADMSPQIGATSGTDFSGVIVALGPHVTSDSWRAERGMRPVSIGDRVFGGTFGNNPLRPHNGAFANYVAVPARLIWHVPDDVDLFTAATLGAALATVGLSLFNYLELPLPYSESLDESYKKPTVLVYGGGTATGTMALQVLKQASVDVITTCSTNASINATRLGAKAWFDYKSPTCGPDIREYTQDSLTYALDCITDTSSMAICYEALGSSGGKYVALDAFPVRGHTRRSVIPEWVCTPTQFGHAIRWTAPYDLEPRPHDLECAEKWYVVAQRLIDSGHIEPPEMEERKGGLAAVSEGVEEVRRGLVKGRRLVYSIESSIPL
ncbi:alcohol dehydrogenase like domain-containing protein [Fusarium heterosporum]|uniref:Alcohol dehydrogenase like domain-containing protein n=1 Tax=Fusarium heterosporum TaxID=42747 RepID=A0A8H5WIC9_FUSHE|nr:alcohol dehydrogenase like domain-containing protein [Fusarium heterosporum]